MLFGSPNGDRTRVSGVRGQRYGVAKTGKKAIISIISTGSAKNGCVNYVLISPAFNPFGKAIYTRFTPER